MGSDADNKGPTRNLLKRHTITTTMHNNDIQTSENMKSQHIEMRNCRACAVMHVNKQTSILKKLLGLHPKTKEAQHVEISCVGGVLPMVMHKPDNINKSKLRNVIDLLSFESLYINARNKLKHNPTTKIHDISNNSSAHAPAAYDTGFVCAMLISGWIRHQSGPLISKSQSRHLAKALPFEHNHQQTLLYNHCLIANCGPCRGLVEPTAC